jgi:hypothetical protein
MRWHVLLTLPLMATSVLGACGGRNSENEPASNGGAAGNTAAVLAGSSGAPLAGSGGSGGAVGTVGTAGGPPTTPCPAGPLATYRACVEQEDAWEFARGAGSLGGQGGEPSWGDSCPDYGRVSSLVQLRQATFTPPAGMLEADGCCYYSYLYCG